MSEWTKVQVSQNGIIQEISFARGHKTLNCMKLAKLKAPVQQLFLKADPEIFETTVFNFDTLKFRLQELRSLTRAFALH